MNNEYDSGLYGTNLKYFEDSSNFETYYNDEESIKEYPNVAYIEGSEIVVYNWDYETPEDWDPDEIVLTEDSNPTVYHILDDADIPHEDPDGYTIGELQAITAEGENGVLKPFNSGWGTESTRGTRYSIFNCYNYYDGTDWTDPDPSDMWTFDEFKYFTGLTELPERFFDNCHGLKSITIPRTINKIGERAFHDCWWLENIELQYSSTPLQVLDCDYFDGSSAFIYTSVCLDPNWDGGEDEEDAYDGTYISSLDRLQNLTVNGVSVLKTNERVIQRVSSL